MKHSLANRLTFRIMAVVLVMMAVITSLVYYTVRKYMLEEAQKRYESILQRGHEEFRRRLSDVMVASRNSVYDVEKNIDDLDKTMAYMKRYLQMNPTVITCGVLYKPGYFPNRKRCLELYASRAPNGKIYVEKIENDYNVYLDRDWFKFGMERDSAN